MLSKKELERILERIQNRLDAVNTLYIRKIAEQIKKIGELNQSSVNRLVVMADLTSDVETITRELSLALNMSRQEVAAIYQVAMRDIYTDPRFTRAFERAGTSLPDATKARMIQYANAVSAQTAQSIENLSNTTAVMEPYREAVDKAIFAVSSGMTSYQAATREALRSIGYNGMQVQYASGYHRRLDTALRQNIIDGTNQIAQNGARMMGEVLDYDAIEISAHAYPAPDHAPIQGRVFLKSEFDKLQAGLPFSDVDGNTYGAIKRAIGEWNCQHIGVSFSTRFSTRQYPNEQLDKWNADNRAGCEIDGKHYTTYQASQLMRKLETESRRWKDTANAARIAGNDQLRRECQEQINLISAKYLQVAKLSGLPAQQQRMTVEGFKPIKI